MLLFENCRVVPAFQNQTGAAIAGDWVSMKNYHKCAILVHEMRGANGTASVLRVDKARDVSGTDESTGITLNNFWYVQDLTSVTGDVGASTSVGDSDTWTKGTAGASITGSTTQSKGQWYWIEVDGSDLPDTTYQDYDCIQIQVVSSNSSHNLSAWYILYEPRYAQSATPTAITD
jgi:hypothetical protein